MEADRGGVGVQDAGRRRSSERLSEAPWAVVLAADATGLGAVRSLCWAGIRTVAVVADRQQATYWSRYAVKRVVAPGVDLDEGVREILERLDVGPAVVIPTSDRYAALLVKYRDSLPSRYTLSIASPELVTMLNDKALETRRIEEIGVPMPRTVQDLPDDPDELISRLGLPMIMKPTTAMNVERLRIKAMPLKDRAAVASFYETYRSELGSFLAQELIAGEGPTQWVCNCAFDTSHTLVDAVIHRKLSTSPPQYGVTCHGRVERNDEIVALSQQIGRELGYIGPGMFDFKYDEVTGTYKYLELNPRIGMCNAMCTHGGVNIAADAYRIALGWPVEANGLAPKPGIEYYNAYGELYSRLHSGPRTWRSLVGGALDVLRVLIRRPVCPYWSWRDPAPALVWSQRLGRGMLATRARRLGRALARISGRSKPIHEIQS